MQKEIQKLQDKKCPSCPSCSDTAIRIQTIFINETKDISQYQEHALKNLIPKNCYTGSCSAGYFEAKYSAMEIFGFEKPKFSERSSSNYDSLKEETHVIPVYNDGFSDYFELPAEYWYYVTNDTKIKFRKNK